MTNIENKSHPKGLYFLYIIEILERFSFFGMRSIFTLYLINSFFNKTDASEIYGSLTGLVYLTSYIGGRIADKYWGNRKSVIVGGILLTLGHISLFCSAAFVKKAVSVDNNNKIIIDNHVNNNLSLGLLFLGFALLIIGNGFFMPTINALVGDLYEPNDSRKDSAYTIFYNGLNLGCLFSPIVCSTVTPNKEGWKNPQGYKWGFLCASLAMALALILFIQFKNKYLVTPEGLPVGLSPEKDQVKAKLKAETELFDRNLRIEAGKEPEEKEENKVIKNSPICLLSSILLGVMIFIFICFIYRQRLTSATKILNTIITAMVYSLCVALPIYIITDKNLTRTEKSRIIVIYILAIFCIVFWASFGQAGSSLTFFAEEQVDRNIFGWVFPTAYFQSVNPVAYVILTPVMTKLWEILHKYNAEPRATIKQAFGLFFLALGYGVIAYGVKGQDLSDKNTKFSIVWLFILYVIHTFGEICLSPIGLSLVNKLSPVHLSSSLMGVWFMGFAVSNLLSGRLATYIPEIEGNGKILAKYFLGIKIDTLTKFFSIFVIMGGIATLLLFLINPFLKRMMKGIK